jgi:hypothetical protein
VSHNVPNVIAAIASEIKNLDFLCMIIIFKGWLLGCFFAFRATFAFFVRFANAVSVMMIARIAATAYHLCFEFCVFFVTHCADVVRHMKASSAVVSMTTTMK